MKHSFPVIQSINQAYDAIRGCEEFIAADRDTHIIFNYLVNFSETFPEIKTEADAIKRECRGLVFSKKTGKVISRRFHKFFNIGEKPETRIENLDLSVPHRILEKLDGSMITPLWFDDLMDIDPAKLDWGTKMGCTDVAKPVYDFVKANSNYGRWVAHVMAGGKTPIFEWCSRKQKIVIDYPEDRLVLTAIRDNVTGEYVSYDDMLKAAQSGIEVVRALPGSIENLEQFMAEVNDLTGAEGYVIRFENGHMVKIKGAEYLSLHRALDSFRFEKDIIRLILDEKLDDLKGVLAVDLSEAADKFAGDIFHNTHALGVRLFWEAQAAFDNLNGSKKRFAIEVVNGNADNKPFGSLLFKIWDKVETGVSTEEGELFAVKLVRETLKDCCGTQTKVDQNRKLMGGLAWINYGNTVAEE